VRTRDLPKVVRDWPRLAAFFIGQLLETLGSRNILWGTDC